MSMRTRYIGKKGLYQGKYLLEILANLRDFGVGRMVARSHYIERYPEPCYHIVRKVEPLLTPEMNKGTVWVETFHRGQRLGVEKLGDIGATVWVLIPKDKELAFTQVNKAKLATYPPKAVAPAFVDFPPLLERILQEERDADEKPRLKIELRRGLATSPVQEGVEAPLGTSDPKGSGPAPGTVVEQVKKSLVDPSTKKRKVV